MTCAWCRKSKPLALLTPAGEGVCVYCLVGAMKRLAASRAVQPRAPVILAAYRDAAEHHSRRGGGQALTPADPWPFTGHRSMADILDSEREAAE